VATDSCCVTHGFSAYLAPIMSNAQGAVDQANFFIVACVLSNHPNAKAEVEPTLEALPAALSTPAAALDNGYERRTLPLWKSATSNPTSPLAANRIVRVGKNASPLSRSRRLRMPVRRSRWPPSYGPKSARPSSVCANAPSNPSHLALVTAGASVGIIKVVLGFRQFSLRGLDLAAGEWCLVYLAFNLRRLDTLSIA